VQSRRFTFHHETHAELRTSVQVAFEYLDDFRKLSAHMEQPSAMMLGSRMQIFLDDGGGRAVGSRVSMTGSIMGLSLSLQEVVVERNPPLRKAWETENARLLVIGQYRLGFDLEPRDGACGLRVFIDYDWPRGPLPRLAARMLAKSYARWCTQRMLDDAAQHFGAVDAKS